MINYIIRRLVLMIPTLIGVTLITFAVVNLAPGSPIEQKLQQLRFAGSADSGGGKGGSGTSTVSNEVLEALKKQYGFDKPAHIRYWIWLKNLAEFDFGESFTYEEPVSGVIVSKFPVSLQFGIVSLILSYLIAVPLGIMKALKNGSQFDKMSSFLLFVAYSIPPFMLGILMITYLAGRWDLFPIGGLYSDFYDEMTWYQQISDRIYHFILPTICYTLGSFTSLTLLMKNSMLDVIKLDYIRTAKAKGLDEKAVYFKHALRNALIPIVTGLGSFMGVFFAGSLLLEKIFGLDGMGLLGYNSMLTRDYNVILGLVCITSFVMLVGQLISDILYVVVDPRIDFE